MTIDLIINGVANGATVIGVIVIARIDRMSIVTAIAIVI